MGGSIVFCSFWSNLGSGTIKSCYLIGKMDVWAFQKIITQVNVKCMSMIIFWNTQKSFFLILMQLLMVPLSWADQKLPKTIEAPHPKICEKFRKYFFKKTALNIHFRWMVSIVLVTLLYAHDSGTIKSCIRIGKNWFLGISKK